MLRLKHIFIALVVCGAVWSCTRPDAVEPDTGQTGGNADFAVRSQYADIEIFAFRNNGSGKFEYHSEVTGTWGYDNINQLNLLESALPIGEYRFLFMRNYGSSLTRAAIAAGSTPEQVVFALGQHPSPSTYCLSADELYLQDTYANSRQIYDLTGKSSPIVECRMTRAVSRVDLRLKRGYIDGNGDLQIAKYTNPATDNISDYFGNIEFTVKGAGASLNVEKGAGNETVYRKISAASASDKTIDGDGFATFYGPFVIPSDQDMEISLDIEGKAGKGTPDFSKSGIIKTIGRNENLIITLVVNNVYMIVGVIVDVAGLKGDKEGPEGIWE